MDSLRRLGRWETAHTGCCTSPSSPTVSSLLKRARPPPPPAAADSLSPAAGVRCRGTHRQWGRQSAPVATDRWACLPQPIVRSHLDGLVRWSCQAGQHAHMKPEPQSLRGSRWRWGTCPGPRQAPPASLQTVAEEGREGAPCSCSTCTAEWPAAGFWLGPCWLARWMAAGGMVAGWVVGGWVGG